MDFSKYSGMELIQIYGELVSKMRENKLIRSKNVVGDLGEYIVVDYYTETKGYPKLQYAPTSTKNIDVISVNGEHYSIKCIIKIQLEFFMESKKIPTLTPLSSCLNM